MGLGLGIKQKICNSKYIKWADLFFKNRIIIKKIKNFVSRKAPIYYIIGYEDPQSSGWTVWERVVLYNCIYAQDHHMVPVVDMKNSRSIYQEDKDFGKVNVWDQFYFQPGGVSLEDAINSGNYVKADTSKQWFDYIRARYPHRIENETYLRESYSRYIRLKPEIEYLCEEKFSTLLSGKQNARILGIKIRGTDYKQYHHTKQPSISKLIKLSKMIFEKYNCDFYFLSTEDPDYVNEMKSMLPEEKVIIYNSGNTQNYTTGFLGDKQKNEIGAYNSSIEYLMTLWMINKCICLIGGVCGATIVAKYRRNPPYEYINIIDPQEHY